MRRLDPDPETAAERARRSRIAQGLPPKIVDPRAIAQVARIAEPPAAGAA